MVINLHINAMIQNSNVHYKSSDLCLIMKDHFGKDMNLARIKAMSLMICALCKVQGVAYTKLALAFDSDAKASPLCAESSDLLQRVSSILIS